MTAPNSEPNTDEETDPLDAYMQTLGIATPQEDDSLTTPASPGGRRRTDDEIRRRNRRFEYCQRRLRAGDPFFGDAAMKDRDAALYRDCFGRLHPRETPPDVLARARDALVRAFCERFLRGDDDADIDYAAIDGDAGLDDLRELGRAAEERYFADD